MQASTPWWKGISRYQWLVLAVAWLGWVFDVMDTALFNFAKQAMLVQMLGPERYAEIGARLEGQIMGVFLAGWALGGLVFGILADRWGRTRTLMLTILLYCLFTGLTALCRTPGEVAAIRFLTGLGIGGEWAAGAALVAEVFPNFRRAFAAAVLQSAAALGPILAVTIRWGLVQWHAGPDYWRWMFVAGIFPAFLTILIRARVREPERWERAAPKDGVWSGLAEFGRDRQLRRRLAVAVALALVGIAGAMNVSFWHPNLVAAVSEGLPEKTVSQRMAFATYTLHLGTLLGVFAFPWLCERWGRRKAFALFFVGSPVAIGLVTLGNVSYQALLLLSPLLSFFAIGLSAGFALYFPELFPTRLRATGSGFSYNVSRVLTIPFPYFTGLIIGMAGGSVATGVAAAALIYLVGLLALPFAPETRGQGLPD